MPFLEEQVPVVLSEQERGPFLANEQDQEEGKEQARPVYAPAPSVLTVEAFLQLRVLVLLLA